MERENILLLDMDGTVCDFEEAMRRDLQAIAGPSDPDFMDPNLCVWDLEAIPHMKARRKMIMAQPGWWVNLRPIYPVIDLVKSAQEMGYKIHILTKGPYSNRAAWSEKVEWCQKNLVGNGIPVEITITQDKGLVYGRVLIDDYIPYMERWLQWRPRGYGIMPKNSQNVAFRHPNVEILDTRTYDRILRRLRELLEEV